MTQSSGYRNGRPIYPISVVDHKKTTVDPLEEKVKELEEIIEEDVKKYDNVFFVGAGSDYTDVFDNAHMIPVGKTMKTSVDVSCSNNDHIILVIKDSFRNNFLHANMNGIEILFDKETIEVDGVTYSVLTSQNDYQEGTYNIDIN